MQKLSEESKYCLSTNDYKSNLLSSAKNTIYNNNNSSKFNKNIINFIKQKKNFFMQNNFDEKGAKKFLFSKELALREIQIIEEMSEDKSKNDIINKCDIDKTEKPQIENNLINKRTFSLRKKKIKKGKTMKNLKNNEMIKTNESSNKFDGLEKDEFIYKCIIENINESEDELFKKIHKKLNEVKIKREEKNNMDISKSDKKKRIKNNNKEVKINPFAFSEFAKNLMISEKIKLSGIDCNDNNIENKIHSNVNEIYSTSIKKEKTTMKDKKKKILKNDINSDKELLVNLLSHFI